MTTPPPFGFANDVAAAAAVPPVPAQAPVVAAADVPAPGSLVTWTEYDTYDELHPERVCYGLVVGYDEHGAAQVLAVGEARRAAHFGPTPADPSAPHGPVVADLTVVR
jgi:hypothetical protein